MKREDVETQTEKRRHIQSIQLASENLSWRERNAVTEDSLLTVVMGTDAAPQLEAPQNFPRQGFKNLNVYRRSLYLIRQRENP